MSKLSVTVRSAMPYTMLPNVFIDHYMTVPNPAFALVYIMFYRHCAAGGESLTVKNVAQRLRVLESDVVNALTYWHEQGLISLALNGEELDIDFLPLRVPDEPRADAEETAEKPTSPPAPSFLPVEARPNYTAQELEVYRGANGDIRHMFETASHVLGKLLSHNDMNVLFALYDWLRFPVPLIEELLTVCADNGHRSMRYIEKCALDWAENGVKTVEDARAHMKRFNSDYREILKAFGHTGRGPTVSEIRYMEKWLTEYAMPLDLIAEACDKTIMQTGQPRFSYADKILARWHESGVTCKEEAAAQEESFRAAVGRSKDAGGKKPPAKAAVVKPNRFVNFKQRDWDYDEIEKLERQFLINGMTDREDG